MIVLDNGSVMILLLLGRTDKTTAPVPFWHTRCIHMIIRDDESVVKMFGTRRQYRPRLVPIQGQLALPIHPFHPPIPPLPSRAFHHKHKTDASHKQRTIHQKLPRAGPFRGLNPGPPAPKAGIIPLDQTDKLVCWKDLSLKIPYIELE